MRQKMVLLFFGHHFGLNVDAAETWFSELAFVMDSLIVASRIGDRFFLYRYRNVLLRSRYESVTNWLRIGYGLIAISKRFRYVITRDLAIELISAFEW